MQYRELETILAELHSVEPYDRGAFRSRLRVLRDIGVPAVVKPGKGAQVTYQFLDLWEAHLGLLLEHFGLPPAGVKIALEGRLVLYDIMREREKTTAADIWALVFGKTGAVTLIKPLDHLFVDIRHMDKMETNKAHVCGLINLSKLTRECESAMAKHVR